MSSNMTAANKQIADKYKDLVAALDYSHYPQLSPVVTPALVSALTTTPRSTGDTTPLL